MVRVANTLTTRADLRTEDDRDQGRTWDLQHPLMLAFASWDNYGGHPRSIVMPDASIMTGYYARYFKEHATVNEDIVSHCLDWNVPDHWPPVTQ